MPIHRGRAAICGRDGRTNQRTKYVCHPSNGHGGSSSGRFHPGPPRSRMAMQRMGVQTSQPWPHVRRLALPMRVFYLYFISSQSSRRGRDVVKFSTTHICWGNKTTVLYHIGKFQGLLTSCRIYPWKSYFVVLSCWLIQKYRNLLSNWICLNVW